GGAPAPRRRTARRGAGRGGGGGLGGGGPPAVLGVVLRALLFAGGFVETAVPAVGGHDAGGVGLADRLDEGGTLVGARGRGHDLGVVVLLLERLQERGHGGHVNRAEEHGLGAGRGHLVGDGLGVGQLRRKDLGVDRLVADALQLAMRALL